VSEPQGPSDDAPVGDEVALYRLIPTAQCDVVDGEWAFQSAAFDNTSGTDEMSIVLGDTLQLLERVPDDLPERIFGGDPDRWGVAVLSASAVRAEDQDIRRSPVAEEPAHGDVVGPKGSKRRRRLKKSAEWVVPPTLRPD